MAQYTTRELAELGLPGFPRTSQGWDTRVKAEAWEFIEVTGARGRGGVRREFIPPADLQAIIDAHVEAKARDSRGAAPGLQGEPVAAECTPESPTCQGANALPTDGFRPELLEAVVRGVEKFCERNGLKPTPEKKAIAISLMYRYAVLKGKELGTDDIAAFFKLAA